MGNLTFSNSDKERIKEAVADLESESSGELVIYFAKKSHEYKGASWKLAGFFGIVAIVTIIALSYLWLLPAYFTPIFIALTILVMMGIGFGLGALSPKIRLSLIPENAVNHAVITKARDIFLQEEVFDTRERTGILIYISELEHEVVVLGDSGINSKIGDHEWTEVVDSVLKGIKSGKPAEGLVNAAHLCKELLLDNGFLVREDDKNELSDDIRIEE